jgi:hypothetical protein
VNVASAEPVRADLEFAFEHDAFLFALVAVRRNDAARPYAHQARVHARRVVPAQLAHFYERSDLDPLSLTATQRTRARGRLFARAFQNSTAQPLALFCAELHWPYRRSERIPQATRQVAII